jgi:membrane complex biogenesis BtpA family protein
MTFQNSKLLIGMIHLPNLRGYSDLGAISEAAVRDALALADAGFDGALIENYHDCPESEFAPEEVRAACAVISPRVVDAAGGRIKIGVQLLLNDWPASFAICKAAGAAFTRMDVFVDDVTGRWGEIRPDTDAIRAARTALCPDLFLFADVQVKHKAMIDPNKPIELSARQAADAGADAVVATGEATGIETPIETVLRIKAGAGGTPTVIGAGLSAANARGQLGIADGAIVGSSILTNGRVDTEKAREIVRIRDSLA